MTRLERAHKQWAPYAENDACWERWRKKPWYLRWLFRRPAPLVEGRCAAWEERYFAEREKELPEQ